MAGTPRQGRLPFRAVHSGFLYVFFIVFLSTVKKGNGTSRFLLVFFLFRS